jgi:tight adherence protein B
MPPAAIRLLVLILIFAATLLAVEGAINWIRSTRKETRAINERLRLIERGIDRSEILSRIRREPRQSLNVPGPLSWLNARMDRMVVESGFNISTTNFAMILAGLSLGVFIVAASVTRYMGMPMSGGGLLLLTVFALCLGIAIPCTFVSWRREKRRKALIEQFPLALDIFVRGLRAGHPVAAALELLTTDMGDPIGSEFGIVVDEVTYGLELRDALQNMADRCGIEDMNMFVVSLSVQAETGGNLAEILDNLTKVIRDRASMMLKVRALSSEGRVSGMMLTALPMITFAVLFVFNPGFFLDVADDPMFFPGFAMLLGLYAIGAYSIRRMVDLKV